MLTEDVTITIPTEVRRALRIPEREIESRLQLEVAVHLYEEWLLSFGKARELAKMSHWEFAEALAKRQITRHYTEKDCEEDVAFASTAGANNGR